MGILTSLQNHLLVVILAIVWSTTAAAQSFDVMLGGRILGILRYSDDGSNGTLRISLDNTPIGVFDGSFLGTSRRVRSEEGTVISQYLGESESSRKARRISVLLDREQVLDTVVSPLSERTNLSDPSRISVPVIDPVMALRELMSATGCPTVMHIYDGRRVVSLVPSGMSKNEGYLTCDMDYTVTDGPGHLSPLYITRVSTTLRYEISDGQQVLDLMSFQSGPLALRVQKNR